MQSGHLDSEGPTWTVGIRPDGLSEKSEGADVVEHEGELDRLVKREVARGFTTREVENSLATSTRLPLGLEPKMLLCVSCSISHPPTPGSAHVPSRHVQCLLAFALSFLF